LITSKKGRVGKKLMQTLSSTVIQRAYTIRKRRWLVVEEKGISLKTLSENIILKKFKNYPRNNLQPRQAPQKVWTRFLIPIIN